VELAWKAPLPMEKLVTADGGSILGNFWMNTIGIDWQ
jgi:hypothetical protein